MPEIVLATAAEALGDEWAALTFSAYRSLLAAVGAGTPDAIGRIPVALCAESDGRPAGLIVARYVPGGRAGAPPSSPDGSLSADAELLSVFVVPDLRNRGLATALVAAVERELALRGARRLAGIYMTGKPSIPALEKVFEKRGFSPPCCAWSPSESRRRKPPAATGITRVACPTTPRSSRGPA